MFGGTTSWCVFRPRSTGEPFREGEELIKVLGLLSYYKTNFRSAIAVIVTARSQTHRKPKPTRFCGFQAMISTILERPPVFFYRATSFSQPAPESPYRRKRVYDHPLLTPITSPNPPRKLMYKSRLLHHLRTPLSRPPSYYPIARPPP